MAKAINNTTAMMIIVFNHENELVIHNRLLIDKIVYGNCKETEENRTTPDHIIIARHIMIEPTEPTTKK